MKESTKALINGGLRSIAASFPVFENIAQAWSEYESYQRDQRVEEFFHNMKEQLACVEEKLETAQSHHGDTCTLSALVERTIEKIQKEPSLSKRRIFAIALLRGLTSENCQSFDDKLTVIETLDDVTESDLKNLALFSDGRRIQVDELVPSSQVYRDEASLGETISTLVVSLCKLESRGLIGETTPINRAFNYPGDANHWANRWRRKTFEILPFGSALLESIRKLDHPQRENRT